MRLFYQSQYWRKRHVRVSKYRSKQRARFAVHIQRRNMMRNGQAPQVDPIIRDYNRSYKIAAPKIFSIRDNVSEMNRFIRRVYDHSFRYKRIGIDAGEVKYFTPEAAIVLLMHVAYLKRRCRVDITGNYPEDPAVKAQWNGTGFGRYVISVNDEGGESLGTAFECQDLQIYQSRIRESIINAICTIDGHPLVVGSVSFFTKQLIITCGELVNNVHEHAATKKGKKMWWFSVVPNIERSTLQICIADMGMGIAGSVERTLKRGGYSNNPKLSRKLSQMKPSAMIIQAIRGKLRLAATRNQHRRISNNRGYGMRELGNLLDKNIIDSLHVITNDIALNCKSGTFVHASEPTRGTIYCFETTRRFWSPDAIE